MSYCHGIVVFIQGYKFTVYVNVYIDKGYNRSKGFKEGNL